MVWVWIPFVPYVICVNMGKELYFFVPQFAHLKNGVNGIYLIVLWEINEFMQKA